MKVRSHRRRILSPFGIAAIYGVLGVLWIVASDRLVSFLFRSPETLTAAQTVKGWVYVLVTAGILYALIRAYVATQRRDQTLLEAVFDATHEGIVVFDRNLAVARHNAIMQDWLDESADGRAAHGTPRHLIEETGRAMARAVLESGMPQRQLIREAYGDGSAGWLEILTYPMTADDTSTIGVVAYFRDVTTEREALAQAERRERLLRLITDSIPANVGFIDANMCYGHVNRRYEELFGIAVENIVGRPVREIVGESVFAAIEPHCRRALAGETVSFRQAFEYPITGARWTDVSYVPEIDDESGHVAGFHVLALDVTETQIANDELRRARATLQAAIEQTPAGILIADAASERIHTANSAALDIHGFPSRSADLDFDSFEGVLGSQLFLPDGTPLALEGSPLYRALTQGASIAGQELRVRREDGSERWILANAAPIRDDDGRTVGAVAIFPDITERRRSEESLRFRAEFERRVVAISTQLIATKSDDLDDLLVWALRRIGELFGFNRGSITTWIDGQVRFLEFIEWAPEGATSIVPLLADMAPILIGAINGLPDGVTLMPSLDAVPTAAVPTLPMLREAGVESHIGVRIKRGERFNAYVGFSSAEPNREWSDEAQNLIRIFADLVGNALDHRNAEVALRASETRLRTFIDQASDLFLLIDRDGTFHEANRAACAELGYSRDELIGAHLRLIDPAHGNRTAEQWRHLEREGHLLVESELRRKDGSVFPAEIRVGIATIGAARLGLAWVRNITDQRRRDAEARRLQNELAHAQRLGTMGEMATGFAHELNQPLAAIRNYAAGSLKRMERGTTDAAELTPILERIAAEAARAGEIIRRVRSFVSKRPPEMTELDIESVIRTCITLLASEARHAQVSVTAFVAPEVPKVLGDEVSVQQVLINLIRNGIEAIGESQDPTRPREVAIHAESDGRRHVRISVADSGPGMPQHIRNRLFEPFFTTKDTGTGMGLSICRTIIEALGGRLSAESEPGRGSVFSFTLPVGGVPAAHAERD